MQPKILRLIPWLASAFTLIIYCITLAPSVQVIDSGELATVQATLGVAHPTGYPLFTLIGHAWSLLPFGTMIFRLNLLAAIFCATGNFFFIKTAFILLKNLGTPEQAAKKKGKQPGFSQKPTAALHWIAAAAGTGFLAFSKTYWLQSTGVEVYALHIFLLCLTLFYLLRAYFGPSETNRAWIVAAACLGFCFTNHLTALLIVPGALLLFIRRNRLSAKSLVLAGTMALVFVAINAVLYASLPLIAASEPLMNWGNPQNAENFMRHLTAFQYRSMMFSAAGSPSKNFNAFIENFPAEFSFIGIIFLVLGAYQVVRRNSALSWFFALCMLSTVFYAVNYDIRDLLSYYLLFFISAALLMSAGIVLMFEKVSVFCNKPVIGFAALVFPVFMIVYNYGPCNQSDKFVFADYTVDALQSVDSNAIILTHNWDTFESSALYFQYVEQVRRDVLLVDTKMLKRSWYYDQLRKRDPAMMSGLEKEIAAFRNAVKPFERGQKYDGREIQLSYENFIAELIRLNYSGRPVYIGSEILENELRKQVDVRLPPMAMLIPEKHFYRVADADTANYKPLQADITLAIRFPAKDDFYSKYIRMNIVSVLTNRMMYEMAFGRQENARRIYTELLKVDGSIDPPPGF